MRQINLPVKKDDTILKEFDPIILPSIVVGTAWIAIILAQLIFQTGIFIIATKPMTDKKLTKQVNKFLGTTKWRVILIKEKSPNAFVMGPRIICITSGLMKLLNSREVMGVMLHEAWHVKDLHVYKQFIYKFPFFYLIAMSMFAVGLITGIPILGTIFALIMFNIYDIPYKIIMGRKHERAADSYAAKMGYGDELISALNKLEKWYRSKVKSQPCGKVCQFTNKIGEAIDEHPPLKNRIENILKSKELAKLAMKKSYIKILKFIKKGIK
jgi:Zn-dependent protease with chaperone function